METKELRIGNYLQLTETSRQELWDCCEVRTESNVGNVDWINENEIGICVEGESFEFEINDIEPIPLIEEWLVKSNAKRINDNFQSYILERFILTWKSAYKYWYVMDSESLTYLTKIEFVHEWQNFYFVMQGEELRFE